ncbi:pyruvate dehydrogenase E1 component [Kutzneria viridogrisea]|uniref:Pyruvate dehydrogenase E1 component n=1 Tax=Kutzneria viridogrisea TaxID=47990 RepID=A0ABR6BQH6_9PSEU|nr:pyruvate dehydrogenase E1 component [Kutzneria viridogrisea]
MTTVARVSVDADKTLLAVERRILWLATSIVHHANHLRGDASGVKVGGHQASSASMASIMTALWFTGLSAQDRVSVKPHASPVLHAINHLLGDLDTEYLTRLRDLGGLQSYPSRTKDPDTVDFSTGSVGIGATATIWAALARRYVDAHFGGGKQTSPNGRMIALLGDAELDEGAVWEAVLDPQVVRLGELLWVVDLNRQSLDRVVPGIAYERLAGMFRSAGWEVLTCKYGPVLEELFGRDGGELLRQRIDGMPNAEYQRLLRVRGEELRARIAGGTPDPALVRMLASVDGPTLHSAVRDLGGHDLGGLTTAFQQADPTRPTVVFAYTIKGRGLPTEGHPANHSALLTPDQYAELARSLHTEVGDPWRPFEVGSAEAELCGQVAERLRRPDIARTAPPTVPVEVSAGHRGSGLSTQAALGRLLTDLRRAAPEVAARVVTVSPDVASSTNLAGWLNKVGVFKADEVGPEDWFADDPETRIRWAENTTGQHVELGIAEVNLVGALGELGATWSRWGQPLIPIGTIYDPFVNRALEPWTFGIYAGGQSILVGTPSGVTLAAEGGAHQSVITPSVGLEHPGVVAYEPAFGQDLEWTLLHAMRFVGRPDGCSAYFRLSTRPVDQSLAEVPAADREQRRRQAVAGGYRLRAPERVDVVIAAMGVTVPQAVRAAEELAEHGISAAVNVVTSADLLFRATRARTGLPTGGPAELVDESVLDVLLPPRERAPLVTVLDGHPHTLAFLGAVRGVPTTTLGVTGFGQSSTVADAHRLHGIDVTAIRDAALDLVD